eukprot:366366-Chlamydomonas_euryale.AAC.24
MERSPDPRIVVKSLSSSVRSDILVGGGAGAGTSGGAAAGAAVTPFPAARLGAAGAAGTLERTLLEARPSVSGATPAPVVPLPRNSRSRCRAARDSLYSCQSMRWPGVHPLRSPNQHNNRPRITHMHTTGHTQALALKHVTASVNGTSQTHEPVAGCTS